MLFVQKQPPEVFLKKDIFKILNYSQENTFVGVSDTGVFLSILTISLYRSPIKSSDTFEDFAENCELNLDKIANKSPYLLPVLGDFNVKSSNWHKHDKTTYECCKIDEVTSQFGLQQLIKEPTHILTDSSSFTSQPNLVMESGVLPYFIKMLIIK